MHHKYPGHCDLNVECGLFAGGDARPNLKCLVDEIRIGDLPTAALDQLDKRGLRLGAGRKMPQNHCEQFKRLVQAHPWARFAMKIRKLPHTRCERHDSVQRTNFWRHSSRVGPMCRLGCASFVSYAGSGMKELLKKRSAVSNSIC